MVKIWKDMALGEEIGTNEGVKFCRRKQLNIDWVTD